MSIESWEKEFLRDAKESAGTEIDALEQSLLKYQGFLPENLKRHVVKHSYTDLVDEEENEESILTSENCALCIRHYKFSKYDSHCSECPIDRHSKQCDMTGSAWRIATADNPDPIPMIKLLTELIEKEKLSSSQKKITNC